MLRADVLQADTRATPCSQPLRSCVTDGIGTVTDILDQPYDLYIYRCYVVFTPTCRPTTLVSDENLENIVPGPLWWSRYSSRSGGVCASVAVFDLSNPKPDSYYIQWICPFSARTRWSGFAIRESAFDMDSLAKPEVDSSITNVNKQQWRQFRQHPRIQIIRFASESKFGFTVKLNLDSVKSNTASVSGQ